MITIMGATGHVGGKVTGLLQKTGEKLRLVARSVDDLRRLVGRRVEAMAGEAQDTEFLVKAFTGADAVFTLIPPNGKAENFAVYAEKIGTSIARALEIARVNHVVNLSSIGAELPGGTGPIASLRDQEERLNGIAGLNVLHLRAGYFMENLIMNVDLIKSRGMAGSAVRGDLKMPMIATRDIASFAADRLSRRDFSGSSVRYLLGRSDLSMTEAVMTLGIKIGRPNLSYGMVPYEKAEKAMIDAGLSPDMSKRYIEMARAFNDGRITIRRSPENSTSTTFDQFCEETLVPLFIQKKAA